MQGQFLLACNLTSTDNGMSYQGNINLYYYTLTVGIGDGYSQYYTFKLITLPVTLYKQ